MVQTPVPASPSTCTRKELVPGALCWAKLSRYPWWPALILDRTDSRIPPQERRSTQTATPVLFFGTAEFSWIDASRNISPWETEHEVRSMKDDSQEMEQQQHDELRNTPYVQALQEAQDYADEARLPANFAPEVLNMISDPQVEHAVHYEGAVLEEVDDLRRCMPAPYKELGLEKRAVPLLAAHEVEETQAKRRRRAAARQLGLVPPWNSPHRSNVATNPALLEALQSATS